MSNPALFKRRFLMHVASTLVMMAIVGAASYELFSSWPLSLFLMLLVFFVYKHFKGSAGRRMWRVWCEQLVEYEVDQSYYHEESAESGIGFIQGLTVLMGVSISSNGVTLYNRWAIEVRYVFLPWETISRISVRDYEYSDIKQLLAKVHLTGRHESGLLIPWVNDFASFVPSAVGLSIE